jgi:competence protein ComEA
MAVSTRHPPWGWTTPVRLWLGLSGALVSSSLIVGTGPAAPARDRPPAPRLIVDPNTAPAAVLGALPRIGPAMCGRIVAARDEAPFRSLEDLDARVRGIGPATLASLRPYLKVEPSDPGAAPAVAAMGFAPVPQPRPVRLVRSP